MYVCNWTEDLNGIINYLALARQNNFFLRILIIRGMTFEFDYLGEFEFIFENSLGSWSGDQELAFDEKNECQKSHASVPLRLLRQILRFFFHKNLEAHLIYLLVYFFLKWSWTGCGDFLLNIQLQSPHTTYAASQDLKNKDKTHTWMYK
jgi:hypothetical protein